MVRMLAPGAMPLFLLIAACSGSPTGNAMETTNTAAPAGNTAATVENLPEGQRTAVFLRAIRDAGQQCQTVTRSQKVSTAGTTPTWQVTCDDGREWIVAIDAAGTATVADRASMTGSGKTG